MKDWTRGKRVLSLLLVMLLMLQYLPVGAVATEVDSAVVFYVSPNGSDDNAGTLDSPFATLAKAQVAVRAADKSGGVTVYLREGSYSIADALTFGTEDSGTEAAPVIWRAYNNESVIFTGKATLANSAFSVADSQTHTVVYSKLQDAVKGKVYVFDLTALLGEDAVLPIIPDSHENKSQAIEGIFMNGAKGELARYPDAGYMSPKTVENPQIYASPSSDILAPAEMVGKEKQPGIMTYADERIDLWANEENPLLKGFFRTTYYEEPTKAIVDAGANKITTGNILKYGIANATVEGKYTGVTKFYGFNLVCELDTEGEYYIDRSSKLLYIYDADNDLSNRNIQYSVSNGSLVSLSGASNLHFIGIEVEGAFNNGITVSQSNNILIKDCYVHDCGKDGIQISGGSSNIVRDCKIENVGYTGISANGGNAADLTRGNHLIENCDVSKVGNTETASNAVAITGVGNTVRGCYIHNTPHTAIEFGGCYQVVEYNEIMGVCQETADSGAIYAGGTWLFRGNTVRYNYIHDCSTSSSAEVISGIYFDDSISDVECYGNVIVNVKGRGFLIANGRDHDIHDNLVIGCNTAWVFSDRGPRIDAEGVDTNVAAERWRQAVAQWTEEQWNVYRTAFPELVGVQLISDLTNEAFTATTNLYTPSGTRVYDNVMVNTPYGTCTDRFKQYAQVETELVENENNYNIASDLLGAPLETYQAVLTNTENTSADVLNQAKTDFLNTLKTAEWTDQSWNAISSEDELKTALTSSGRYYLTQDIQVAGTGWSTNYITHAAGTNLDTTLDLNGFSIIFPKNSSGTALRGVFMKCDSGSNITFTLRDSSAMKTGCIKNLRIAFIQAECGTFNLEGGSILMSAGDIFRGTASSAAIFNVYEGAFKSGSGSGYDSSCRTHVATAAMETAFTNGTAKLNVVGTPSSEFTPATNLKTTAVTVSRNWVTVTTAAELSAAITETKAKYIRIGANITATRVQINADEKNIYLDLNGYTVTASNRLFAIDNGYNGTITFADHSAAQTGRINSTGDYLLTVYKVTPTFVFVGGTYSGRDLMYFNCPATDGSEAAVELWEGTFSYTGSFIKKTSYSAEWQYTAMKEEADSGKTKYVATPCTVTKTEGTGSSITLSGGVNAEGEALISRYLTVTVGAAEGYQAESFTLTVNGQTVALDENNSYTLLITGPLTLVSAAGSSEQVESYAVTTQVSGTGTINAAPLAYKDTDFTFSVTPGAGHFVKSVTVNEAVMTANADGSYTVPGSSITGPLSIAVVFEMEGAWQSVSTEAELKAALSESGRYYLTQDIQVTGTSWSEYFIQYASGTNLDITLDLNGYSIVFPKNSSGTALRGALMNCKSGSSITFTLRDSSALKTGSIEYLRNAFIQAENGTFNIEGGSILMYAGDIFRGSDTSAAIFNIYEGTFKSGSGSPYSGGTSVAYSKLQTAIANGTAKLNVIGTPSATFDATTNLKTTAVSVCRNYAEVGTSAELIAAFTNTLNANGNQSCSVKLTTDIALSEQISLYGTGTGSVYLDLNGHTVTLASSSEHSYFLNIQQGYTGQITIADHSMAQTGTICAADGEIARSLISTNGASNGASPKIAFIGGTYTTDIHGLTFNKATGTVVEYWDGVFNWDEASIYAGSGATSADGVSFFYLKDKTELADDDSRTFVVAAKANVIVTAADNTTVSVVVPTDSGDISDGKARIGRPIKVSVTATEDYAVTLKINGEEVSAENGTYTVPVVTGTLNVETVATEIPAQIKMHSILLEGNIGINYWTKLSSTVLNDAEAYILFTMPDGSETKIPISQGVEKNYDGKVYYTFKCEVAARQMTDQITAQIFYMGGSSTADTYCVRDYANCVLNDSGASAELKALVTSMLHYGAYAQKHFGYKANENTLADQGLTACDLSGVTLTMLEPYAPTSAGTELVQFRAISLLLKANTDLRFFFTLDETVANFKVTGVNGEELKVTERDGMHYVDVTSVAAQKLDESYTVKINDGVNSETEVTASPLSYCYNVLKADPDDEALKDLVRALFLYNQAANTYFDNLS